MIVDCNTQIWDVSMPGRAVLAPRGEQPLADASHHLQAVDPVDRAFVLAFKSRHLSTEIPNHFVADYVRRNARKMVGFAGIDPTEPGYLDELRHARTDLQMKGVVVSPALQNFHPCDSRAEAIYDECARMGMPLVFEQSHLNPAACMEFGRPHLLDEVARNFPNLRLVIAHMGFPWVSETIALLGKHRNVFADIAGLLPKRWLTYNALLSAFEYGVMDKLLFGSNFPFRSPTACIEALYSLNQMVHGTNLVPIPREQLRGVVERDALALLGIDDAGQKARHAITAIPDDE